MTASTPELASRLLVGFLEGADLDGAMSLYEDEAVFAELDGVARGLDSIRRAHERFLDAGLTLELHDSVAFEADDLALVHWSWTVRRKDGSTIEGASAEVLRRQADLSWKFIIDNSDGAALIGRL